MYLFIDLKRSHLVFHIHLKLIAEKLVNKYEEVRLEKRLSGCRADLMVY